MDDNKKWLVEIIFRYIKLIFGIIVTFFPFSFQSPIKEIMISLGILIVLTSGIKIQFSPHSLPVVRPEEI